jgi:aminoglycoside phosphotransferase (APT) family kinase protein
MSSESNPSAGAVSGTPAAELRVDEALVRRLLQAQHPDLAGLALQPVDSGWDNFIFRLGQALAVRLPRRAVAAALVEHEQAWLPGLAATLPLPVPAPIRIGLPAGGYPWRWSVVPWIGGAAADLCEPDAEQAAPFAGFLQALHVAAPAGAPHNPYRGVPLAQRADAIEQRMERLEHVTSSITAEVRRIWRAALAAPADVATTWIHGDLHARNVLVERGRITGVIDWGDLAAGDRATDLASIWMVFAQPEARAAAIRACGEVSDATWARARGWAVLFGVLLSDSGRIDQPRLEVMGRRTLERVASGP